MIAAAARARARGRSRIRVRKTSASVAAMIRSAASSSTKIECWTLLARASLDSAGENRRALEELCRRYWMPINRFIQARGISASEAEDLTQEFMVHILERSLFLRADRFQGRFRSFLIGALIRFLRDKADQRNALKRGAALFDVHR